MKINKPNVSKINLTIKSQNAFANFDNAFYTQYPSNKIFHKLP